MGNSEIPFPISNEFSDWVNRICRYSDSAELQRHINPVPYNGELEEDTSGYLSDTPNNTIDSPDLAVEHQTRGVNTFFEPGRAMKSNNDFSELQYATYNRKPPSSSSLTEDARSTNPGRRVRKYYEENGNMVVPAGYQNQVARSVKSRSTFAGDDIDLELETDFSIPKYFCCLN